MHIYVHIPFCKSFCNYCNFYSVKSLNRRDEYIEALINEAKLYAEYISVGSNNNIAEKGIKECHTLYLGGGTPSCLSSSHLQNLVGNLLKIFPVSFNEITLEANPNDISVDLASVLCDLGINRVSLGVQSFIDNHLKWMGRRHTSAEVFKAVDILRNNNISNISLDLIFGYQLLSKADWRYNIDKILEIKPNHISAYQMSIESGSNLSKLYNAGRYSPPSDELCESQYKYMQDRLSDFDYCQYEISNFSLRGDYNSKHNSAYWKHVSYLGLGPFAHSFDGSIRRWNRPNLSKYIAFFQNNPDLQNGQHKDDIQTIEHVTDNMNMQHRQNSMDIQQTSNKQHTHNIQSNRYTKLLANLKSRGILDYEELNAKDMFNESVMLGLRTVEGINLQELSSIYPEYYRQVGNSIERLINSRKLELFRDAADNTLRARISREHLFIADNIIRDLFVL